MIRGKTRCRKSGGVGEKCRGDYMSCCFNIWGLIGEEVALYLLEGDCLRRVNEGT